MSDGDDDWDMPAEGPTYLFSAIVIRDHIPATNAELTLIADDLVYVFKTEVPGRPDYWEGESKNVYGIFPKSHVKKSEKPGTK